MQYEQSCSPVATQVCPNSDPARIINSDPFHPIVVPELPVRTLVNLLRYYDLLDQEGITILEAGEMLWGSSIPVPILPKGRRWNSEKITQTVSYTRRSISTTAMENSAIKNLKNSSHGKSFSRTYRTRDRDSIREDQSPEECIHDDRLCGHPEILRAPTDLSVQPGTSHWQRRSLPGRDCSPHRLRALNLTLHSVLERQCGTREEMWDLPADCLTPCHGRLRSLEDRWYSIGGNQYVCHLTSAYGHYDGLAIDPTVASFCPNKYLETSWYWTQSGGVNGSLMISTCYKERSKKPRVKKKHKWTIKCYADDLYLSLEIV